MQQADPTPAVFINERAADRAARVCVGQTGIRKAVVLPHAERGAVMGWKVLMHFEDRRQSPMFLTNAEVPL